MSSSVLRCGALHRENWVKREVFPKERTKPHHFSQQKSFPGEWLACNSWKMTSHIKRRTCTKNPTCEKKHAHCRPKLMNTVFTARSALLQTLTMFCSSRCVRRHIRYRILLGTRNHENSKVAKRSKQSVAVWRNQQLDRNWWCLPYFKMKARNKTIHIHWKIQRTITHEKIIDEKYCRPGDKTASCLAMRHETAYKNMHLYSDAVKFVCMYQIETTSAGLASWWRLCSRIIVFDWYKA